MGGVCSSTKDSNSGENRNPGSSQASNRAANNNDDFDDDLLLPDPNEEGGQLTAIQKAQQKVDEIIKAGQPWTDPEFPPEADSLANRDDDPNSYRSLRRFSWKRCSDIMNGVSVFQNDIHPNDINQGSLGNCYFLAVLSSMAERPDSVKAAFYTQEINAAGVYLIYFYVNGIKSPVIVDDYIPVHGSRPAFSSTRENEIWAILMEKAWAKLQGTYARTVGGLPADAGIHTMGVPGLSVWHDRLDDKEKLWRKIKEADTKHFNLMAGTRGQGEANNGMGIYGGHAYSLISVHEVETDEGPVRLLKLRNPWGRGEWKGDWSDGCNKWTDELREQCGCVEAEDGIFFITFEEYCRYYNLTDICMRHDEQALKHSRLICDFNSTENEFFSFELKQPVDTTSEVFAISTVQQGDRLASYRNDSRPNSRFTPSEFDIMLMRSDGQYIASTHGGELNFHFSLNVHDQVLEPGKYTVLVDPKFNRSARLHRDYKKVLIDVYCPQHVKIMREKREPGVEALRAALKSLGQSDQIEKQPLDEDVEIALDVKSTKAWYGFIYIKNNSGETFSRNLRPSFQGLEVYGGDDCIVDVPAGGEELIILRQTESWFQANLRGGSKPASFNDDDMVNKARNCRTRMITSNLKMQQFESPGGQCCILFTNTGDGTTIIHLSFQMSNARVKNNEGASISLHIPPGESSPVYIEPIEEGQPMSMRFSMQIQELRE